MKFGMWVDYEDSRELFKE